jgi:hypothetical protein
VYGKTIQFIVRPAMVEAAACLVGFADFGEPRESVGAYEGELHAIRLMSEFQRKVSREAF